MKITNPKVVNIFLYINSRPQRNHSLLSFEAIDHNLVTRRTAACFCELASWGQRTSSSHHILQLYARF